MKMGKTVVSVVILKLIIVVFIEYPFTSQYTKEKPEDSVSKIVTFELYV
jgi:hypothetical protein